MDIEVIVIDNHSEDGTIDRLSPLFPAVSFIQSLQNLGFAKASNRGFRESSGEYILFLNPDTIIAEDSLRGSIEHLRSIPKAGALGIRMIDGRGCFLRESKRAFPDTTTAFYKVIGLSGLFPRSPRFARYHLGHLANDRNHSIDVVCGAYFMVHRSVLEQVGAFDENFFMYGEDIDLSYRIQQAGYQNQYYSGATILHFKGESTRKQSFRYVKLFYGAMSQFVRKHRLQHPLFTAGIQLGIGLRAFVSALRRLIQRVGVSALDGSLILLSFLLIRSIWSTSVRPEVNYPENILLPTSLYALFYFTIALLSGLNRKPFSWSYFFRSNLFATAVLLIGYSLLPESLRYSRGMVSLGSLLSISILSCWRLLLLRLNLISPYSQERLQFPVLFIGTDQSRRQIEQLYKAQPSATFLHLEPDLSREKMTQRLNGYHALIRFSDIVFCTGDLPYRYMFSLMEEWGDRFTYRFYTPGTSFILPLRTA